MRITDEAALDAAGVDRRALAERMTRITAKMVLADGFFHADIHPGNLFIESTGRIGLIDFGQVGVVDDHLRRELRALLVGLARNDPGRLTETMLVLGASPQAVDRARLREDLARLMERYSGGGSEHTPIAAAIGEILVVVRRYGLRVPRDLAVLLAVVVMEEGLVEKLDPAFRFGEEFASYAKHHVVAELSPASLLRSLERFGIDAAELSMDLPRQVHRILQTLGSGGLEVHLRAEELQPLVRRAERLGNRIAFSVLAAAVIDAMSELAAHDVHRRSKRRPMLAATVGLIGSLGAYGTWKGARPGRVLAKLGVSPEMVAAPVT